LRENPISRQIESKIIGMPESAGVTSAVLINVDDSQPARYARGRVLTLAGFTVYEAATGAQALRAVERYSPDLVLLDVHLPDLDGIEVCRRLKASDDSASVVVLQISASATQSALATAALNSGADGYLSEPVDPDVLVATVRALLRLRRAERGLMAANARLHTLNRDLKRSNEDLQQFAFMASHDLQEPLRTVTSFASLLERSAGTRLQGAELEYLQHIVQGSQRMRLLIEDLLEYSQAGQKMAAASVDLNHALKWVLENLRELIAETHACVTSEELPVISGDTGQLRHVLQNLIGNAIKYRKPEVAPIIRVTADRERGDWVIRVQDNGLGIESEYSELIFAPFKRLHGSDIPGTGIGLAMCRRVIEAHGGRIWIDSTPGIGSTFSFTLPATGES
jgi:signal transduction histidine kinase